MQSKLFSLVSSDYIKGLIIAVLVPVVSYIGQVLTGGGLEIDWTQVLHLALAGFIAYISKNFVTDSNGKTLGMAATQTVQQKLESKKEELQ